MDAIFVNGTVGVGKSTLADALSDLETVTHGVIDLDEIRRLRPSPPSDPFNLELELANLRDMGRNFSAAGVTRMIVRRESRRRHLRPITVRARRGGP